MLPIDLCKDEDIADLLQGNSALLEAAKKGNLAKVKKLVTPENIVSFKKLKTCSMISMPNVIVMSYLIRLVGTPTAEIQLVFI